MMPDKRQIEDFVRRIRPHAKFVRSSYSKEFLESGLPLLTGFFYISLYDLMIDSNILRYKKLKIVITNSYLPSFAYNLILSVLVSTKKSDAGLRGALLKHNLKKFFAEQVYGFRNCLLGRGMLLETLIFEEPIMIPVFREKEKDIELDKLSETGSRIMSNLVLFHEFGHLLLEEAPLSWDETTANYSNEIADLFSGLQDYRDSFITELKCDIYGLIFTLSQNGEAHGLENCLRAIAFGYGSFAVMMSLQKSAKLSADLPANKKEVIDLQSTLIPHYDYEYELAVDPEFIKRMRLMVAFCEKIGISNGIDLYAKNPFGLTPAIIEEMFDAADTIFTVNDENAAKKSLMLARAFDNHPDGMEYLYLNSRKFIDHSKNFQ